MTTVTNLKNPVNKWRCGATPISYYYFIRLMGRKASHVALECALQSHPNMVKFSPLIQPLLRQFPASAVCSLQSLRAASPAKSELAEIVPQEKSPKGNASFFRSSSFLPFLPHSFFNGCGSICTCSIVILLFH
uniref:Pyrophosphate--fructose 6-phosphate 1-phosphotransferase subunit alpha 2 n=1 Tax=Zea mays TaxID=4577 RepID=A0A804PV35_MAIZE